MKSDPGVVSSATEMQSDASPLAPGLGAGAGEGAGPGAGEGEGEGEGVGDGAGDGEGAGAGLGGGGVTASSLPPQAVRVSAAAVRLHSMKRREGGGETVRMARNGLKKSRMLRCACDSRLTARCHGEDGHS